MKLNKEKCLNELEILCSYADMSVSGEFVGKMLQEADDTLHQLIEEHFKLEKALDRAIENCIRTDGCYGCEVDDCEYLYNCGYPNCVKKLKEYYLNDERL